MIDFPITPTLGQQYTEGDRTWECVQVGPPAIWDIVAVSTADAEAAGEAALEAEAAKTAAEAAAAEAVATLADTAKKSELASTTGATLVATPEGTVQEALDGRVKTDVISAPDGAKESGFIQVGEGAAVSNLLIKVREIAKTPQDFVFTSGKSPTSDDTDALLKLIEAAKGDGLRQVRLPRTGYGYRVETELLVDFGGIDLIFEDGLALKATTKSNLLLIKGAASGVGSEIQRVSLIAPYPVTFDGNASNMTGYDYLTQHPLGDSFYSTVLFQWASEVRAKNIRCVNGLVNSLRTYQVRRGVFEDCRGSTARWDNGISVDFDPQDFDPLNPDTWSNIALINPTGDGNTGFGLTSFGATGTRMLGRVLTYGNGNNNPAINPGPGGGISAELNGTIDRDYRFYCENPVSLGNFGRGLFVSATGSKVVGQGSIEKTKIPTAYTDAIGAYGNGVAIFGAKDVVVDVPVKDSERYNYFGALGGGRTVGVEVGGKISGAAQRGLQMTGVDKLVVNAEFENNGLTVGATQVDAINVDNTTSNAGAGIVKIGGRFKGNGGSAARVQGLAEVYYDGISGLNNNANHTPQSAIFADNNGYVDAKNIDHRGAGVTTVLNIGSGNARAVHKNVTGDATATMVSSSPVLKSTSTGSSVRQVLGDASGTFSQCAELLAAATIALTTNRTWNLNTTNPTEGDKVRVYRPSAATGSTLTITDGTLSVVVAAGAYADFIRTSNAWNVTGTGTVP